MRIFLTFVFFVFALAASAIGQSMDSAAPVNWERYRISGTDISIEFPKVPIRIDSANPCDQVKSSEYFAYAEDTAYRLKVVSKNNAEALYCQKRREFGRSLFNEQLAELEKAYSSNEIGNIGDLKDVTVLSRSFWRTYVIDDLKRDRWIELSIVRREQDLKRVERFVASLRLEDKDRNGRNIGKGSPVTVGDLVVTSAASRQPPPMERTMPGEDKKALPNGVGRPVLTGQGNGNGDGDASLAAKKSGETARIGLIVAAKPRPQYTEAARQNQEQGTVVLRVTFLKNGSIGSVSVVKGLGYGLTEQAMAAARKIVFLPARLDDVDINVVKQVEYTFSIY